jgi:hypothetical protein
VILLASAMVGSWRRARSTVPPSANVPGPHHDGPAPTVAAATIAAAGRDRDLEEPRVPALVG